jgi:hypothetical protein
MANHQHLEVIMQGVAVWNAWREKNPEVCPDLSGAILSGASLVETDLSGADLHGASLIDIDLSNANLSHANLSRAYSSTRSLPEMQ